MEFSTDILGRPLIEVYPDGEDCWTELDLKGDDDGAQHRQLTSMLYAASKVVFFKKEEEVKEMPPHKVKISKKKAKEIKKEDYYAGKEVKACDH